MNKILVPIIFIATLVISYKIYEIDKKQSVTHEIILDLEADQLEKSDKQLKPIEIKQGYIEAISTLKKPYKNYTRIDKIVLKHNLGTVYSTRHRVELAKLMPMSQIDVDFRLKEVEKRYHLKYKTSLL